MAGFMNTLKQTFKDNIADWDYLLNAYKGKDIEENYLYKWVTEETTELGKKVYERRKKITPYFNFSKKIVKSYNNFIYKDTPKRENFPKEALEFSGVKNYDKQIKATSIYTTVCGKCWLFIDKDNPSENIKTKKDEIDNKLFPYLVAVPPNQVYNWTREIDNSISQVAWYKIIEDRIFGYYWDREVWEVWVADYLTTDSLDGAIAKLAIKQTGANVVKRVPVLEIVDEDADLIKGTSTWYKDIVKQDITYYNKVSVKNLNIDQQALGILILPDSYEQNKEGVVNKTGTSTGYYESGEEQGICRFISPDSDMTIKEIREDLDADRAMIYFMAGLTQSRQLNMSQSVESKEFDFVETEKFLSNWADIMERAEKDALKIIGLFQGQDYKDVEISYNKEFIAQELADIIAVALDIDTMDIRSNKFKKHLQKSIITAYAKGKVSPETLDEMLKEVEEADFEDLNKTLSRFNVKPEDNPSD